MTAQHGKRGSRHPRGRGPCSVSACLLILGALAVTVAGCGAGADAAPTSTPVSAKLVSIGAGLKGPSTLKATVYDSGLRNASAFALDRRGRLWVTTSAATDHADDGVYLVAASGARAVKVISGLKGPLGLTWIANTLYVASIGRVDAFSGLSGSHFSHRRRILTESTGHGWNDNLIETSDGRLAMGISAPCDHCTPTSKYAASIITFRTDGSDVRVFATGIRAPYGLAGVPGSSDLYVTMNQRDDLGTKTPADWLSRVSQGQDWGFPACYGQDMAACASAPKPIAALDTHAAAGGVLVVDGGASALVAEWATGTVMTVALKADGSTAKGTVTTFLTGMKDPLALAKVGDTLLVGDWTTGTIYAIAPR